MKWLIVLVTKNVDKIAFPAQLTAILEFNVADIYHT